MLGHERYEDLLRKAGVLNEQFIDRRTRAVLRRDAEGKLVSTTETEVVTAPLVDVEDALSADAYWRAPVSKRVAVASQMSRPS